MDPEEQTAADGLSQCDFYESTYFERMEHLLTQAVGAEQQRLLDEAAPQWVNHFLPNDTIQNVREFLLDYCRAAAATARVEAVSNKRTLRAVIDAAHPLYMALGTPSAPIAELWEDYQHPKYSWPPQQEDFDRRAASWLREVIIAKDITKLTNLAEALKSIRCRLSVGIPSTEVWEAVPDRDSGSPTVALIVRSFHARCKAAGKLPTKKELKEDVEAAQEEERGEPVSIDKDNFRKYLKALGFNGLQESPRGPSF